MAEDIKYKLIRSVDPTKIEVPIKDKFAKLTLSATKKKKDVDIILAQKSEQTPKRKTGSRNLMELEWNYKNQVAAYENPLFRSNSITSEESAAASHGVYLHEADKELNSTTLSDVDNAAPGHILHRASENVYLEQSIFMEPLQLSFDDKRQQNEVDELSQMVSELSVVTKTNDKLECGDKAVQQNEECVSICISTSTEENNDEITCVTISDSSHSEYKDATQGPAVSALNTLSGQISDELLPIILDDDKTIRMEAFLRDVSFERHEMIRRGEFQSEMDRSKQLAIADTESMSQFSEFLLEPNPMNFKGLTGKTENISCNISVPQNFDKSKQLADDDTELNTLSEISIRSSTPIKSIQQSTVDDNLEESVIISETSSESEKVLDESENREQPRQSGEPNVSTQLSDDILIKMSSINISAKINIKIQIPSTESNSSSDSYDIYNQYKCKSNDVNTESTSIESDITQHNVEQNRKADTIYGTTVAMNVTDSGNISDNEDKHFLQHAEKLLNQLYGNAWQTPEVIRKLKHTRECDKINSSSSFHTDLNNSKSLPAVSINKNKVHVQQDDKTIVSDNANNGSITFQQNNTNSNKNSPHLLTPSCKQRTLKGSHTELCLHKSTLKQRNKEMPQTEFKHRNIPSKVGKASIHKQRWRQLIDSESDSEFEIATNNNCCLTSGDFGSGNSSSKETVLAKGNNVKDNDIDASANKDGQKLNNIFQNCGDMKLKTPESNTKTKRQLFNSNMGYEGDTTSDTIINNALATCVEILDDLENVYTPESKVHKRIKEIKNKKHGTPPSKPIFKLPKHTPKPSTIKNTKIPIKTKEDKKPLQNICLQNTRSVEYGFLKSLEGSINIAFCHPDAVIYRTQFRAKRDQLTEILYELYNRELFESKLNVPITWNKHLKHTAGRCTIKIQNLQRVCVIELSDKVLTQPDRLRCTLLHELCHAAAWIFDAQKGHGPVWKRWARRANKKFPELPKIEVCHDYEIEYKYSYKCSQCDVKGQSHSKLKNIENRKCPVCFGSIETFLNKKGKDGTVTLVPTKQPSGFTKFVKDNFKNYKQSNLKNSEVMKILSAEYAKIK